MLDKNRNILKCDCCGKQILDGQGHSTKRVTYGPVTLLGVGIHACGECAKDPLLRHQYGL